MGHGVQESQVATYRRRMQREAPAAQVKTLFEQNEVLRQAYTVTVADGHCLRPGDRIHALVNDDPASGFSVTDSIGRDVGSIRGESGRVLAEVLQKHDLTAVRLAVEELLPVTGDARVLLIPE
jgi:hypothetical protein